MTSKHPSLLKKIFRAKTFFSGILNKKVCFTRRTSVLFMVVVFVFGIVNLLVIEKTDSQPLYKAELQFTSLSPAGESGGSVVPASCPSDPHTTGECDPPPPPPWVNLSCNAAGTIASLTWGGVTGATSYGFRYSSAVVGSPTDCMPGLSFAAPSTCYYDGYGGTSFDFPTTPGAQYRGWIHSQNANGMSAGYTESPLITCPIPPPPPADPTLTGSCVGTTVSFSWTPAANTTNYSFRMDDQSTPWSGTCAWTHAGDVCTDGGTATSYSTTGVAGRSYRAWVHGNNASGGSPGANGLTVTCPPPAQPNLISYAPNFSIVGGATHQANNPISFLATAMNTGSAEASPARVDRFYYQVGSDPWVRISSDQSGVPLGVYPGGANGGAQNQSTTQTFSQGTYNIYHCVDQTNTVSESNEADNCAGPLVLTVTAPPSPPPPTPLPTALLQARKVGTVSWTDPSVHTLNLLAGANEQVELRYTSTNAVTCLAADASFNTSGPNVWWSTGSVGRISGDSLNGITVANNEPNTNGGSTRYALVCSNAAGSATSYMDVSAFSGAIPSTPTFTVSPSVVRLGESTVATYDTKGNDCTLTRGTDVLATISPTSPPVDDVTATNIQGETTFTLSCAGHTPIPRTVRILQSTIER